jgi:Fe-S-cluster containining protein
MSEKNKMLCDGCDECCRYIALQIDKPTTAEDYDYIMWFLLHQDVHVYIDFENDWFLEFATPCKALDPKTRLCKIYNKRPNICREHKQKDCVRHNSDQAEKISFNTADEFKEYWKNIKKKKKAKKK